MEKAKKRRIGIITSIILTVVIILGVIFASAVAARNARHVDTWERVQRLGAIRWGVKADTKLFGLMNTKSGEPEGFDVDIAKALTVQLSKQSGVPMRADFTVVTSNTRIQLLKNANIDGFIATATITPEREKIIDFSNSYFKAGQAILVKDGSGIKNVRSLNNSKSTILGVVGSNSVINIKKFAPKARVLALGDYGQAMAALKAGQGQALTTDNGILYGLATENPGYSVVGGTFTTEPYGVAYDNHQTAMVKQTNRALKAIIANGTYNRLIRKWFRGVPGLNWRSLER
ncbi:transporter substrate-binding domain-containing protein [Oenococcus kitaharae]|uniref:Glutamine ABC transporter n=1 Tax=Oenococcus kitaharae DSM 17330 TaxID=1045004 RepID=G9WHH3_9LACO|nr:transporter substrate-binding domain-containing protein [Oenococcus kitaharae]EHN58312.1 Glutamine ABC transporter [Oenococcus kitaharae DSM 17330]MCV3296445.1 transporter substrate-binding domain-containing protein [Oenococcus kitaharae]OEY81514.1 glutamine ABC transporter substrate-binding protein [Oenococcus kitaharae]OEY83001.1 glutamine ABC transporter substrate-binding protein [Oenococcus kitaharae]OEY84454.1 glutamine ABC transporter substrate-binding protein [Oenococcus kitaharae]